MKISSSISLISAINKQKLNSDKIIELVKSLGEHCSEEDLIAFVQEKKQKFNLSAINEQEKEQILTKLQIDFKKSLIEVISNLRTIHLYRMKHKVREGVESFIFQHELKQVEIYSMLTRITNVFGGNGIYGNSTIHSNLKLTGMQFTPEYKIDLDIPAQTISKKDVYFECDYMGISDEKNMFEKGYGLNFEAPSLFFKNITLLQIYCLFGLDDLIEKSVIFGADIKYKETITGLTALELYQPSTNIDVKKKAYIISLLDGTYDNGKYQALYEQKCLNANVPVSQNSSQISHKI